MNICLKGYHSDVMQTVQFLFFLVFQFENIDKKNQKCTFRGLINTFSISFSVCMLTTIAETQDFYVLHMYPVQWYEVLESKRASHSIQSENKCCKTASVTLLGKKVLTPCLNVAGLHFQSQLKNKVCDFSNFPKGDKINGKDKLSDQSSEYLWQGWINFRD